MTTRAPAKKALSKKKPSSKPTRRRGARPPPLSDEVAAVLAKHPKPMRDALLSLRAQVFAAAPGAVDGIGWGMPMVKFGGKHLVGYMAFKAHCSLFPMSSGALAGLAEELGERVGGRGTIHFTPDDPIPAAMVKRLVKLRLGELAAKAAAKAKPRD